MTVATSTITIKADPADVWSVVTAPAGFATWSANHVGFLGAAPDTLTAGVDYREQLRAIGMTNDVRWHVDTAQDSALLVQSGRAQMGVGITATTTITEVDGGVELTVTNAFTGAVLAAVGTQLSADIKGAQERSLAALRVLIEGR
jgi:uncharacterized protein YndB with AHSA1/START domain